jgi:citrate synthase
MELLLPITLLAMAWFILKARDQRERIARLGTYLGKYQIEKLMENLTQGYLRALGEDDPDRRDHIWSLLTTAEKEVASQFDSFAKEFARLDTAATRVSTLPLAVPFATRLLPLATFDMRAALRIHAQGLADAANTTDLSPRDKAFRMSAELFLMQHTCHWYCRSKATASARVQLRHQTPHAQLLASVSPTTRNAYLRLVGK